MKALTFGDDAKGLTERGNVIPSEKPCHSWMVEVFPLSPVSEACSDVTLNNNSSCDSKRQTMDGITKNPKSLLPTSGLKSYPETCGQGLGPSC